MGLAVIIPVVSWGSDSGGWWPRDRAAKPPVEQVSIAVVSSVASMIPQGLALMTTLAFAAAAVALGRKHNILVQGSLRLRFWLVWTWSASIRPVLSPRVA